MVKTVPKKTGKMYFALDSCIEERFSILLYPLILCHLDICMCYHSFYTLCIFNQALNTIFKFFETFIYIVHFSDTL